MKNYLFKIYSKLLKSDLSNKSGIIKYAVRSLSSLKLKNSVKLLLLLSIFISCSQSSPTVNPADIINSYFSNPPGTTNMLAYFAYPVNGDSNIPVDAKLVISFSKNAQDATAIYLAGNITVTGSSSGAHAYTTGGADGRVITITPTVPFNNSETVTVVVGTGVTSTVADDSRPLANSYTWTFTTAAGSIAVNPRVIFGTQVPANGASGISINQSFAEVTFTKTMGASALVAGNYSINNGASISGITQVGTTNTYKINFNVPLPAYLTTYTVALTNSILDSTGTTLVLDGNHTWNFQTESAPPGQPVLAMSSSYVSSVTDTTVTLNWTTNRVVDSSISRSQYRYSTNTTFGAWQNYAPAGQNEVHAMGLSGLTQGTKYYYQIQCSVDGITWVTASGSFNTKFTNPLTSNGGSALVSVGGQGNNGISAVQNSTAYNTHDGSSYAIWKATSDTRIYGNFIDNDNTPTKRWTANGETLLSGLALAPSNINVFSDMSGNAVIVYDNNTDGKTYAKKVYNSGGVVAFTGGSWGANAAAAGVSVSAGAGTMSSAAAVSTVAGPPDRIMFAYKSGNNILGSIVDLATGNQIAKLIDSGKNFTALGIVPGDTVKNMSTLATATVTAVDNATTLSLSANIFPTPAVNYEIYKTSTVLGYNSSVSASQLKIPVDFTASGIAIGNIVKNMSTSLTTSVTLVDSANTLSLNSNIFPAVPVNYEIYSTPTVLGYNSSLSASNLVIPVDFSTAGIAAGDTVKNMSSSATATVTTVNSATTLTLDGDIFAAVPVNYNIYKKVSTTKASGSTNTSTALSKLIDANVGIDFTPTGLNISVGDIVQNLSTGFVSFVTAVDSASTLSLPSNIFTVSGVGYRIFTGVIASRNNLPLTLNKLYDSSGYIDFVAAGVAVGDIVVNLANNYTALVTNVDSTNTLSLSADIFTATSQNYIIYTPSTAATGYNSSVSASQLVIPVDFTTAGIVSGDVVQNLSDSSTSTVTGITATTLTLFTDIFTSFPVNYRIYPTPTVTGYNSSVTASKLVIPVGFLAAGILANDIVNNLTDLSTARVTTVNNATTLTLDTDIFLGVPKNYEIIHVVSGTITDTYNSFTITSTGAVFTNPKTAGHYNGTTLDSVFVVYENSSDSNIYGKRISATAAFTVGTDSSNIGVLVGTGTLLDIKTYSSGVNTWVYILYQNGGNVVLKRLNQSYADAGASEWTYSVAGSVPSMDIDNSSGDALLAYSSANNLVVAKITAGGNGATTFSYSIPLSGIVNNIKNPKIVSDGSGGAVVAWFDDRYYANLGLCMFTQAFTSAGAPRWNTDTGAGGPNYTGILHVITSIYGYNSTSLNMLFYNDFAGVLTAPYGALYFWSDARNSRADYYYGIHVVP